MAPLATLDRFGGRIRSFLLQFLIVGNWRLEEGGGLCAFTCPSLVVIFWRSLGLGLFLSAGGRLRTKLDRLAF